MEHNDAFKQESTRVETVREVIKTRLKKLTKQMKRIKGDVLDIRKEFFGDVTVNLAEMDDALETQASLKQQAEFLSERERHHLQAHKGALQLQRLYDQPYFGRIDFKADEDEETLPIYIGTASLLKDNDEDFYVYDWRAPIASMYYDYPPGRAAYQAVTERITGEMSLKRQYVIKNGELEGMFDTGLTIGDGLLQKVLGESADTTMKTIVATIQAEQNRIIRHEKKEDLIVRGVAGSGKTSAALQRIAYLLYRYRDQLSADQMLLFSPNPLFHTYVARVLPELGEDQIKQVTFYHYLTQQLGTRYVIESPFEQLETSLSKSSEDLRLKNMAYKASQAFIDQVDAYLESLRHEGMVFKNIRFRDRVLLSKEAIRDYFYENHLEHPLSVRVKKCERYIQRVLKDQQRQLMTEDWLEDEIELLDIDDFQEVYEAIENEQDRMDWFNDSDREEELFKSRVIKRAFSPLVEKVKRLQFVDLKRSYLKLFHVQSEEVAFEEVREYTATEIQKNFLTYEDATPYLYFEKRCLGFDGNYGIKHVILDEAQDYSVFQLHYLKQIYPKSHLTLLGDIHQTIYLHGLAQSHVLADREDAHVLTLNRSYRATEQLVHFTRVLAEKMSGEFIEAFSRQGPKPTVYQVEHKEMALHKVKEQVNRCLTLGYEQVAVVTKTKTDALSVSDWLKANDEQVQYIDAETHQFEPGVKVIPAYLAKGVEFDAVISYDTSQANYETALEQRLLYTALTRAMHELVLISIGPIAVFIKDVPKEVYDFSMSLEINHRK